MNVRLGQRLRLRAKGIAVADTGGIGVGVQPVQHQVHQRQAMRVLHVLHAVEGVAAVFALLRFGPASGSLCSRM